MIFSGLVGRGICLFAIAGLAHAQAVITTFAGRGFWGHSGDGGPAISAGLEGAGSSAVDPSGNVYFVDGLRIRKIDAQANISTIGGTGLFGSAGDGGPALSASLAWPRQLIYLPSGRVCFVESSGHKVRCIMLSTGIINGYGSGLAGSGGDGGHYSSASFNGPSGLAADAGENFYVADYGNNSVRRIDATTGIVTRIAGVGPAPCCGPLGDGGPATSANLTGPSSLVLAGTSLYIADSANNRVRKVDLAAGIITTIAGNGTTFPFGDGGPAIAAGLTPGALNIDETNGRLFVATGAAVRQIDLNTGIITTVAGILGTTGGSNDDVLATEAALGGVSGLGWDAARKRLLFDDAGTRLRQIFFTPATATALTSSANPVLPNGQVTLQATVSPSDSTGVVRIYADNSLLASAPVSAGGVATHVWTAPASSTTVTFRAVYGGDPTHNLSISANLIQNVQRLSTATALVSSLNPSQFGQSVVLTAAVTPAAATGTVHFSIGGVAFGSAGLAGGSATITLPSLSVGSHSLSAYYAGNSIYLNSTSPAIIQTIQKRNSGTALTANPNPSVSGQNVVLTATITPADATGTVEFKRGTTVLGTATISGGIATLNVASLAAGSHALQAVYGGDATTNASTSADVTQTVKVATASALSSSRNPANAGQNVTFTASISPAGATGQVQFFDGATLLATQNVSANGSATYSTRNLAKGVHTMRVVYLGSATHVGSTSPNLTQTIR